MFWTSYVACIITCINNLEVLHTVELTSFEAKVFINTKCQIISEKMLHWCTDLGGVGSSFHQMIANMPRILLVNTITLPLPVKKSGSAHDIYFSTEYSQIFISKTRQDIHVHFSVHWLICCTHYVLVKISTIHIKILH